MAQRILVVDDDKFNVSLMREICERAGYEVDEASDGVVALERVAAQKPDALLLDVMMPRLDGYGVCQALKDDPETADIPVLMVTAVDDVEARIKALDRGADDYITKPFKPSEIVDRIAKALRFSEAQNRIAAAAADQVRLADPSVQVGDYAALRRDLFNEVARAERHERTLACISVIPRRGMAPNGAQRAAWIAEVASGLNAGARSGDKVYLLGSEELVVLLPECEESGVPAAVQRIREALAMQEGAFGVGASLLEKGETATLLRRARHAAGEDKG